MARQIDGLALGVAAAGGLFAYAGIKGISIPHAIQAMITGSPPSAAGQANPVTFAATSSGGGGGGSAAAAPSNPTGNVALGKMLAAQRGWTGAEWNALYDLWEQESGWSNTAKNPTSGAYGIAQALPPTKMPAAAQASGGSSARAQIEWGLGYIASTYGDPAAAWAHEQAQGWY